MHNVYFFSQKLINSVEDHREYYKAAWKYQIPLRMSVKNISRVSGANEWNKFLHSRRNLFSPSGQVINEMIYFVTVSTWFFHLWRYRGRYRRYEFYVRVARTISHSFAALTREILFLPREHKIHIFELTCNVLFII